MKKDLKKNAGGLKNRLILISKNPYFDLEIIETFVTGIVLSGDEIKSLRAKNVSVKESYIVVRNLELFIVNMYIAPYKNANISIKQKIDKSKRKLLMKKSEIRKIFKLSREKSYIISPLKVFINERGWAKLEIALARKLKKYQININLKEKEIKQKLQRKDFFNQ